MEKQINSKKKYVLSDNILYLVLMSTVPIFIVQIIGVLESILFSNYQNDFTDVFIIWTTMIIGLCLIPYYVLKKIYSPSLIELGIKKISRKQIIIFSMLLAILYIYLLINEKNIYILLSISLQTLGVALTEEFWARGILCYILGKISNKKILIILINSIIFTFITHMNRPLLKIISYYLIMLIILI